MITITRRQARRLRGVFRRCALGITHRGIIAPLVLRAEGTQLRAHHRYATLAVEHVEPGSYVPEETVALPLDALADFEGRAETPVVLETVAPDRTVARWDDRGIPQSREYHIAQLDKEGDLPGLPRSWTEIPGALLGALAEAGKTGIDDSPRYALNCIRLRGSTQDVGASDGHQLLIWSGFAFPWPGDVLIRRSPVFSCKELPRDRPVSVGRTDTHIMFRAGAWTLYCEIQADARFPRIDEAVPAAEATATTLQLDPGDAEFLGEALDRLPGADERFSPVTVDCNGRVAIRTRSAEQGQTTEILLSRSRYTGSPVRLNTDRHFLAPALGLGFPEIAIVDANSPLVCRDRSRIYCWQPLSPEAAIEPADDVTRIESPSPTTPTAIPQDEPPSTRTTVSRLTRATKDNAPTNGAVNSPTNGVTSGPTNGVASGTANGHATPENTEPTTLAALIQEAEGLHEALTGTRVRAGRLIVALRRYRKRERLMTSALESIKQLKLQEVAG
jgi:hypothetical protein